MIIIIGGGASGLIAAVAAGNAVGGGNVKIIEKNDRVGRKLLATGSGRCNLTNINAALGGYTGEDAGFSAAALRKFGPKDTMEFFEGLGLVTRIEEHGRVYPKCNLASAVLDVLRNEISRLNIEIIHAEASRLSFERSAFSIYCTDKRKIMGRSVIVSAGGRAAPVFGSNGGGYNLLIQMGHELNDVYPALVQLRTNFADIKTLNGVRVNAGIGLRRNGRVVAYQEGELQFTNYGVSGIPALNVSGAAGQGSDIVIDFSPDMDKEALLRLLEKRVVNLRCRRADEFFTGFFHKAVGRLLLKYAGVPPGLPVSALKDYLNKLVGSIKSFHMPLSGVLGFAEAQVTGGGIRTDGFNPRTMESVIQKGLYAAGEVLDIYGPCGGYNLQWAWSSGHLAGVSAAGYINDL
ncbi:MAG: aminoacetone oxidase family FAD-binding enzyme [Clostridiales bacterium]|jgi:predicted Rossmann fold flavoprotein|nr:aminoacetone oxidase family FAD-binding enzyme [Clostridiales bacterium]